MQVIAEKRWSYVLFDDGKDWILTFLIGGVVEVDISVRLTAEERESIKSDSSYVEQLIESVKRNRRDFANREINPTIWP